MTVSVPLTTSSSLAAESLAIARFRSRTADEWPSRLAASICLQGCPWECTTCVEPALQDSTAEGAISWATVMTALRRRRTVLDAVVFTGGEPTRQPGLADAMTQVRALGYSVGLMTAGAYPGRLAEVLPLVDWVGIDIKAPAAAYDTVTGQGVSAARAWKSLALLRDSGVDYEVTVTVDATVHSREHVLAMVRDIIRSGAHAPVLQQARPAPGTDHAKRLGGRGLYDVIRIDDLPDLERR
jgi:pyruvate formate lyase activating enzyme